MLTRTIPAKNLNALPRLTFDLLVMFRQQRKSINQSTFAVLAPQHLAPDLSIFSSEPKK